MSFQTEKPTVPHPAEWQLWALLDVSILRGIDSLPKFLERVVVGSAVWFKASGASLFLRESESVPCRLAAKSGCDSTVPNDAKIEPGVGIAGRCLESGEPLLLVDADGTGSASDRALHMRRSIGSSMIVPLEAAAFGRIGVLNLSRRRGEPTFGDEDLGKAKVVAGFLALAVSNARLFARLQTALDEERLLAQAQDELSRIRRLAEIGQMAAAIAHEIRNPLTGIRGAAQVIRDDPAQAHEFAGIIEAEVVKLDALCDGFLEFARPMRLNRKPTKLEDALRPVLTRLERQFVSAGVALQSSFDPGAPIIRFDALRIEQVALNLVLNALQATPPGGTVHVRTDGAGFTVEDDGEGMDADTKSMLFTPFFTTRPNGTGLGLSNVKKVLDAHNARIEVFSKPGEGSQFTVSFPEGASE